MSGGGPALWTKNASVVGPLTFRNVAGVTATVVACNSALCFGVDENTRTATAGVPGPPQSTLHLGPGAGYVYAPVAGLSGLVEAPVNLSNAAPGAVLTVPARSTPALWARDLHRGAVPFASGAIVNAVAVVPNGTVFVGGSYASSTAMPVPLWSGQPSPALSLPALQPSCLRAPFLVAYNSAGVPLYASTLLSLTNGLAAGGVRAIATSPDGQALVVTGAYKSVPGAAANHAFLDLGTGASTACNVRSSALGGSGMFVARYGAADGTFAGGASISPMAQDAEWATVQFVDDAQSTTVNGFPGQAVAVDPSGRVHWATSYQRYNSLEANSPVLYGADATTPLLSQSLPSANGSPIALYVRLPPSLDAAVASAIVGPGPGFGAALRAVATTATSAVVGGFLHRNSMAPPSVTLYNLGANATASPSMTTTQSGPIVMRFDSETLALTSVWTPGPSPCSDGYDYLYNLSYTEPAPAARVLYALNEISALAVANNRVFATMSVLNNSTLATPLPVTTPALSAFTVWAAYPTVPQRASVIVGLDEETLAAPTLLAAVSNIGLPVHVALAVSDQEVAIGGAYGECNLAWIAKYARRGVNGASLTSAPVAATIAGNNTCVSALAFGGSDLYGVVGAALNSAQGLALTTLDGLPSRATFAAPAVAAVARYAPDGRLGAFAYANTVRPTVALPAAARDMRASTRAAMDALVDVRWALSNAAGGTVDYQLAHSNVAPNLGLRWAQDRWLPDPIAGDALTNVARLGSALYVRDTGVGVFTANPTYELTVARGDVFARGNVTVTSDARAKTDICDIDGDAALAAVRRLRPVRYVRRADGRAATGLLAHEVAAVVPEAVRAAPDGTLSVSYMQLLPLVLAALQRLAVEKKKREQEV